MTALRYRLGAIAAALLIGFVAFSVCKTVLDLAGAFLPPPGECPASLH